MYKSGRLSLTCTMLLTHFISDHIYMYQDQEISPEKKIKKENGRINWYEIYSLNVYYIPFQAEFL